MTARVSIRPAARSDLDAIAEYIAELNPQAAERIIAELLRAIELLGVFPFLGHERNDLRTPRRALAIPPFVIIHRSTESDVTIIRIVHERRDLRPISGR